MAYSSVPTIPEDVPPPASPEQVDSYLPQYALAFGDMRKQTVEMHQHRLRMGQELQMRRELYLQEMQASNQQRNQMLTNSISRGDVSFGEALVKGSIPTIPEGIVTETLAAENGAAINNSDSPEFPIGDKDIKTNAAALAIQNKLGEAFAELPSFAKDDEEGKILKNAKTVGLWSAYILEMMIPLRYSIGTADDIGDVVLPGTHTKEESKAFWKSIADSKSPDETNAQVDIWFNKAKERFPNNPLAFVSYLMESMMTSQTENSDAIKVFAKETLKTEDGQEVKSFLPDFWKPNSVLDAEFSSTFTDELFINSLNLLDIAGLGSTARLIPRLAMHVMGGRAAAQIAARAAEGAAVANVGGPALRSNLSLVPSTLDIIPEVQTQIDGIRNLGMTALEDRVISQRVLPTGEVAEKILDKTKGEYGNRLVNSKFVTTEAGDTQLEVIVGTPRGNGFATLEAANKANARSNNVYEVVNGAEFGLRGHYLKATRSVDEDGWLKGEQLAELEASNQLNTGWFSKRFKGNIGAGTDFGRYVWSPSVTAIYRSTKEAVSAGFEKAKLGVVVERMLTPLESLSRSKQNTVREAIQYGKLQPSRLQEGATGRWLDYGELDRFYRTKYGRGVTNEEATGYYAYREVSDFAFILGNETERSKMLATGAETWSIKNHAYGTGIIGRRVNAANVADEFTLLAPDGSVVTRAELTEAQLKKFEVIEAYGQAEYKGNRFTHLLVDKNSAFTGGLQRNVLGYTEGGTRNYKDVWFAKQRAVMTLGGREVARNPLTHGVFRTKQQSDEYVLSMNQVVRAYNSMQSDLLKVQRGTLAKTQLEVTGEAERAIQGIDPNMSISKIEDMVEAGDLDLKHPLQTVYDREMLDGFDAPNWERLKNYQRSGKMYYSDRGEHLLQDGEAAPLIDPYTALSNQIGSMVHSNVYKNFAIREVGEWAASFGKNYEIKGLVFPSADELVKYGTWKAPNTPEFNRIRNLAESQRMYVKRVLLQPGTSDLFISQAKSRLAQKLAVSLGDSKYATESMRTGRIVTETSAVQGLRKLAYDLALGFFNVGQFAVQGSAAITAAIMHPLHGSAAVRDYGLIRAAAAADYNSAIVEALGKNLVRSKVFGFKDGEFVKMIEDYRKSGLHLVGRTDTTLDRLGADGLAKGKIANTYDRVRDGMRMPLYEGERLGRIVSFGIARREALDSVRLGEFTEGSAEYYQFIRKTTNKYTLNMMTGMETWWQRNQLTQLPLQFFQYPFKYMEVFLGMNREFTQAEKTRFILGHMFLYGAYGVPLGPETAKGVVAPGYEQLTGKKLNEESYQRLMLGLMNDFTSKMLGSDTAISSTLGSGNFVGEFIKDIYGDNTPIGLVGGVSLAAISKMWDAGSNIAKVWSAVAFNEGMYNASPGLISEATDITMTQLGSVVRSMNNANKAYYLYKYGALLDNRGGIIENDSRYSALLTAAGFRSTTEFKFWDAMESSKAKKERLDNIVEATTKLYIEGNLAYHRDNDAKTMESKFNMAEALVAPLEGQDRLYVIRATRNRGTGSFEETIDRIEKKGGTRYTNGE